MSRLIKNTPQRFAEGQAGARRVRSTRWTILWSFLLTLSLILVAALIATPLSISRTESFDAKQIFARFKTETGVFFQGLEHHGLGWFLMKPVDRLSVGADREFVSTIARAVAAEFKVSAELVTAVIQVSSSFDPLAVSQSGAMGLMQITREDAAEAKLASAFEPWENITVGTRKLRGLIDQHKGNWDKALAAYYSETKAISDDKTLNALVKQTLDAYRTEVGRRYPSLS